jgi:AraC-like DNA-binding protein
VRYPKSEIGKEASAMQGLPMFQRHRYSGLEPSQVFDVVYGGQFEHRLLAAGRATMDHQRLLLENVCLETGRYDFPVFARGVMPRDMVCIGLVAEGIETTRYNTAPLDPQEIQIYPPGVDMLYHAASASRWISFTMPESELQETAIACIGRPLELPRHDSVSVRLAQGARRRLVQLADDAFELAQGQGDRGISTVLAGEVARGLSAGYARALGESGESGRRASSADRQHLHLVLACEQLALSADEIDVGLDEIARRSGYSRRSLELIFKRSVGSTPGRWFMNMRLNGALRELLSPAPECRVADVASRWGFRHLPRFAQHYRRAFGELPSQTLGRAHT